MIKKLRQEGELAEIKGQKEKNDKLAAQQKEASDNAKAQRKAELDELKKGLKDSADAVANLQLSEQQIEEKRVNERYQRLIDLAKKYKKDTSDLEISQMNEINDIRLKYQNEADKAEEERQAKKKADEEKAAEEKKAKELANAQAFVDILKQSHANMIAAEEFFQQQKQNLISNGLDFLRVFAGRNKELAKALLLVEKGLAIAQIVSNTAKAIAQAKMNLVATPLVIGPTINPLWAAQAKATAAGILTAKASAGVAIATILAQTIEGLSGGGAAAGGGGAGGDTGGGGGAAAPQFNIVGQNPNNQLAATIAGQQGQPIRAYVVGQDVTTQQGLDRQIRNTATFNS